MSGYYGDFLVSKTVRVRFNTVSSTGAPTSLSAGAVIVTKDGADVTPSGGVTLTADVGSVVGRNHVVVDMSVDTTVFTAGSEYSIRLSGTANVGGTSVVGIVVGEWSVENRAVAVDASGRVLLQPTQAGVTIPTVTTVGTLTTYTGNTPQTGDAFARLGAAGAGLTAIGDTRLSVLPQLAGAFVGSTSVYSSAALVNAPAGTGGGGPTAAQIATAVLTTQFAESYAADGVAPTLTQAVMMCMQRLTDFDISANLINIHKLDGTTTAAVLTCGQSHTTDSSTRSS